MLEQDLRKLRATLTLYDNRKNSVPNMNEHYGGEIANAPKEKEADVSSVLLAVLRVALLDALESWAQNSWKHD